VHQGAEFTVVVIASLALLVGAGLRLFSARTRFPYTIAMLLIGIATGLALRNLAGPGAAELGKLSVLSRGAGISPDLIIFVFLPALVFESAYAIDVHTFKNNVGAVIVLAGPALLLSTVAVGALMVGITTPTWAWGWPVALVFGALISATDPVAVVAILRELGVSKRLGVLIEGESLLNDGTAIVVFTVLVGLLTGDVAAIDGGQATLDFLWVVSGGLGVGLGLALLLSGWIERLFNDPLSEITLTLVLAYLAMIIAEGLLHVSGVMAVVAAGLWMSGAGKTKISPEVSHFLHRFWETLGYIANTLIFYIVGLVIAKQIDQAKLSDFVLVVGAYVGVMAIRAVLTFLAQPLTDRLSDGVSTQDSVVISWGGLRGAVSLALALIIAQHPKIDPALGRQVLLVTAGVVLLTILVNGTTMGRVLARLGYDKPPLSEQLAQLTARALVLDRSRGAIDELGRSRDLRTVTWAEVYDGIDRRRRDLDEEIGAVRKRLAAAPATERSAGYWRRVLSIERQVYWRSFSQGTLGPVAVKLLSRELDRQLDRLARGNAEPPATRTPETAGGLWGWLKRLVGSPAMSFEQLALRYDLSRAESLAAERVLNALDTLGEVEPAELERMRRVYRGYLKASKERIEDMRTNLPEVASAIETRLARRIELNVEREGYEWLEERGALDEATTHSELHHVEMRMKQLQRSAERVPIPETADLCASMPLFSALDDEGLQLVADLTEEMVVPAGKHLFRQGDKGDSMFVIARGAVEVLLVQDDEELLLDVLGGGDIIGEMALLTGERRTASARAATAVTLGRIKRVDFETLMDSQPELQKRIWEAFAWRNFDNAVRAHPRFEHLDREERRAWFELGTELLLAPGARHELDGGADFGFLVSGTVEAGGERHSAGALIRFGSLAAIEAARDARLMLLPQPGTSPDDERRGPSASLVDL
jgi:NhaP-type Na+/H+ or K+/H+ antiporter